MPSIVVVRMVVPRPAAIAYFWSAAATVTALPPPMIAELTTRAPSPAPAPPSSVPNADTPLPIGPAAIASTPYRKIGVAMFRAVPRSPP